MIDLYYWPTPNGKKVTILLEECGLEYNDHAGRYRAWRPVQQGLPRMNPNHRMP